MDHASIYHLFPLGSYYRISNQIRIAIFKFSAGPYSPITRRKSYDLLLFVVVVDILVVVIVVIDFVVTSRGHHLINCFVLKNNR